MRGFSCLAGVAASVLSACGGPVSAPREPDGRAIAFGAVDARHACFTCHGFTGEGRGDAPRLAGLEAGYIAKQLEDYARQTRPDDVMTPIARALTDRQRRAVALYYATQTIDIGAPTAPAPAIWRGDETRGVRACADCHSLDAGSIEAGPHIAAQPAAYTAAQLDRWRRGVRRNDPNDEMGRIGRALKDEEIAALSAYLERSP
ncbi:c-type cytochrome [Terricaulis sp.]|uniref:c-type cytochrome n=1 Tax=Terricaulis sp. TaxID=2768686 RepID=UPI002ADE5E69|nr:c-type cytochrome [Terricaulis sp.]